MSKEEEIVESIKSSVTSLKFKLERQEAIEKLSEVEMTASRLYTTKAGAKITDVFRSSRFEQKAREMYNNWIIQADKDLTANWDELKHLFLSKEQIAQLDRAQAKYNKKHGILDPAAAAAKKVATASVKREDNPYQKVYQRYTAPSSFPSSSMPSTSSSSYNAPIPATNYGTPSTAFDPESNFVAYNYSTVSIKRPRGRPRTNFSVKGEGGRKRGRPPTKRY